VTRLRDGQTVFNTRQEQWRFVFSPPRPNRLWGLPASYPTCTQGSYPGGMKCRG